MNYFSISIPDYNNVGVPEVGDAGVVSEPSDGRHQPGAG